MRYIFNFPDIGEGLDEGTIVEWYVSRGQQIKSGDALVKMETDKVVTDIPSPKAGTIIEVFGKKGEVVHVGNPLVELEIEGVFGNDAVSIARTETKTEPLQEGSAGVVGTIEVATSNAYLPASEEGMEEQKEIKTSAKKVIATPVARAMAKDLNVDINKIIGSGPNGRIMKSDIQKFHDEPKTEKQIKSPLLFDPERVTVEPLSQIRKTIAKNMAMSKQNAVHMTVHEEVEISELMSERERYKKEFAEKNVKLTYLSFIIKATAHALKQHPWLNSQIDMENSRMIFKNYYNIGIAVDTPEGLVVPVIRDVDKLSIFEIAQKVMEFSEKAKERKLSLEDMKDGTFTITNYGAIGGIFGLPVINYPQAGILGVGRILKKPIVKDDKIAVGNILPLSLSVDHRIVDGGEATRFIIQIMKHLEDPVSMLME